MASGKVQRPYTKASYNKGDQVSNLYLWGFGMTVLSQTRLSVIVIFPKSFYGLTFNPTALKLSFKDSNGAYVIANEYDATTLLTNSTVWGDNMMGFQFDKSDGFNAQTVIGQLIVSGTFT